MMTTQSEATEQVPDYDSDTWIEVPLDFPVGTSASVEEWADELTADALRATRSDDPLRAGFRQSAIAVAQHTRGLASRRFWYFPLMAHTSTIVQFYELPRVSGIDDVLVEFLGAHENRSTDPVVTELTTAHGERVIRVAFLVDESISAAGNAVFAVIRVARLTDDMVNVFELKDEDLVTASQLIADLDTLAASVGNGAYTASSDAATALVEPADNPS